MVGVTLPRRPPMVGEAAAVDGEVDTRHWGLCSVLVADPEPRVGDDLKRHLLGPGVAVTVCVDGAQALFRAGRERPDVVVLSLALPVVPVPAIISTLREDSASPVLLGVGSGDTERLGAVLGAALVAGATGVIDRPYTGPGPLAQIEAQVRRVQLEHSSTAVLTVGALELDAPRLEARADGRPLQLTVREFRVLHYLMANYTRVVSAQDLIRAIWEPAKETATPNTVAVHIRRIRHHLEAAAFIENVRGVGYRLRVPTT